MPVMLTIFIFVGSQMVITDIMPYEKRADALGKLGLFYGIGMVVGPFVGGQITKNLGYVLHRYTCLCLALMRRKNSNVIFSISLTQYVWLAM